jgi:hypothetical protein
MVLVMIVLMIGGAPARSLPTELVGHDVIEVLCRHIAIAVLVSFGEDLLDLVVGKELS